MKRNNQTNTAIIDDLVNMFFKEIHLFVRIHAANKRIESNIWLFAFPTDNQHISLQFTSKNL